MGLSRTIGCCSVDPAREPSVPAVQVVQVVWARQAWLVQVDPAPAGQLRAEVLVAAVAQAVVDSRAEGDDSEVDVVAARAGVDSAAETPTHSAMPGAIAAVNIPATSL